MGSNYYCCFVFDPFGHCLEAVFKQDERDDAPLGGDYDRSIV